MVRFKNIFYSNNYYQAYGQKDNGGATTGIIGGDGSEMLSQNNMFNGYTKGQALNMGGDEKHPARDDNSYFSTELNGTPTQINYSAKKKTNWKPNESNYGYTLLDTYNTNNTDTKAFCEKYIGCFDSQDKIKYITDNDLSSWAKTVYKSPFLKHIDFSDSPKLKENSNNRKNNSASLSVVRTEVYKDKDYVHTIVFIK